MKDFTFLRRISFNLLIVDEAHKIKNASTIISQTVKSLNAKFKLMLTGTPLQNNLTELWTLLNSIFPHIFVSSEIFDSSFDLTKKIVNKEILSKVHLLLEPIMLRRVKKEVELNIPSKKETKIYLPLTKYQIDLYKTILTQASNSMIDGKKVELKYLLMLLMQLRKLCQHPLLFFEEEETSLDVVSSSAKMVFMDKLLKKLKENGSKVLIYSQFTTMLDILENYCHSKDYKYCRLDG
jgi:SWI/SNF-related matrix-associated actin-dependent regulator of chromatin subfamily A member 5